MCPAVEESLAEESAGVACGCNALGLLVDGIAWLGGMMRLLALGRNTTAADEIGHHRGGENRLHDRRGFLVNGFEDWVLVDD